VLVKKGNIAVNTSLEEGGSYEFSTGTGNIDLGLPPDTRFSLESVGNIDVNEFVPEIYPTEVFVNSGLGRISIKKVL
jgi:hypothetical protein